MFSFKPEKFFSDDPAIIKEKFPSCFEQTCYALNKGMGLVETILSEAIDDSVSLLEAEKATACKIMDCLSCDSTSDYDNGWDEFDVTSGQIRYFHGLAEEKDGEYRLNVKTGAGIDICFYNVKITSKGCHWFFSEKITIDDKVVAVDFFRENFGFYSDLLTVQLKC